MGQYLFLFDCKYWQKVDTTQHLQEPPTCSLIRTTAVKRERKSGPSPCGYEIFSFIAKDSNDDDGLVEDSITPPSSKSPDVHSKPTEETNVLDSPRLLQDGILQPKLEDLVDMLHSLWDVRVSFEEFNAVGGQQTGDVVLYKRSLFDIEHQLMSENDFVQSEDGELDTQLKRISEKAFMRVGLSPGSAPLI